MTSGPGEPGVPDAGPGRLGALRLALSLFSVLPVRAEALDRRTAGRALALAPVVGLVLGALVGGVVLGLLALGAPDLLAGTVGVAVGALATRGLHLDGLADLADGLGSYGDAERMLAVMKDPSTGAFGVITLVVVLGAQAAALPAVAGHGAVGVVGVALAWTAGRASFTWCARRRVPAASAGGLGALVAGTQSVAVPLVWLVVLGAAAVVVHAWQGPAAVAVGALAAVLLARHAVRRLGGVNGDVFGAVCEVTVTVTLAGLALG